MSEAPLFVLLALVPVVVIVLISRLSGWQRLSEHYPATGPMPARRKWLGYGVFRGWIGYNGGIVVASDERGLHLAAMPIVLSFCHRPIFIPWSDIREIRPGRLLFTKIRRILTLRAPEIDFALREGTYAFVQDDARRAAVRGA